MESSEDRRQVFESWPAVQYADSSRRGKIFVDDWYALLIRQLRGLVQRLNGFDE